MDDSELEQKLKKVRVPEPSADYWETFPGVVIGRLSPRMDSSRRTFEAPSRVAWAFGFAGACLLVALFFWRNGFSQNNSLITFQNKKIFRETLAMFPNQLRAIVKDERGTELILSEKPDVPSSTPLWIKICDGRDCRLVITFSGQSLQIAKENVEVLADANGRVMLLGKRLFWSATEQTPEAARLRINAGILETL